MLPKTADVVIIGGGVMGASAAYHLARRNCNDVVLLEKGPLLGMEATGKCAGGIRYQFSTEINVRLSLLSLPMLQRFQEELGQEIDLRWPGYLFLLDNAADLATFRHNVAMQNRLGVPSEILSAEDARAKAPLLYSDDIIGAAWHEGDGLADPNGVVQGYAAGARRLGAKTLTGVEAMAIRVEAGRVSAVETSAGVISTREVVNAAGPWAGEVAALAGVQLPITPLRRQIAVTTPLAGLPADFPFVIDFSRSLYFHREGEGILTGQSNPHEVPGFDQSVNHAWSEQHLELAAWRFPLLAQAGLLREWAGLYEVTPDAHPVIDRLTDPVGFTIVAGYSGHGFMHGPGAGLLVAELILDGQARSLDIQQLRFSRFAEGDLVREHNVV
ncbi:MAG: FAD-binding oxidoreductase [Caldilineae bacterium]|nr:FAD-binding oxidoreductase [Anaerolineae bacterium]MCB0198557.1 FAD-binding oxidoreductase [Anaerolineae bacterium]MCB0256137.1 FAD-binding oxidoreductase [Anaerolineae bacterium]MCB9143405.1 FAD-binding oxidoreductase [Anaerolineales bacterium]MCB9152537.1 FAD-binding oxidoreductase [Caldilineae bacterium]